MNTGNGGVYDLSQCKISSSKNISLVKTKNPPKHNLPALEKKEWEQTESRAMQAYQPNFLTAIHWIQ